MALQVVLTDVVTLTRQEWLVALTQVARLRGRAAASGGLRFHGGKHPVLALRRAPAPAVAGSKTVRGAIVDHVLCRQIEPLSGHDIVAVQFDQPETA
jgi:hypothetical protein